MASSFPTVQSNSAVGPWSVTPNLAFTSTVGFGNLILAAWGNTGVNGFGGQNPPTSVTDNLSNIYKLWGQSSWFSKNVNRVTQLWVAQNITGGTCTITFNGAVGGASGGPSLIICEKEVPDAFYELFSQSDVDNDNDAVFFEALANNGDPGGSNSSSTGVVSITASPNGAIEEFTNNNSCCVALMNQFLDVCLVMVNFNDYYPLNSGAWSVSGNLIQETYQPPNTEEGGTASDASMVMTDQDFPYNNGPLQAQCGPTPDGTVGVSYNTYLLADGGDPPYTFTQTGGTLPPGLTLISSGADAGLISGTPTAAGKFIFTVLVADSAAQTDSITCTISICPAGSSAGSSNYAYYARG